MSSKVKYYQNKNVTKNEISQKQNATKIEKVTKTEMLPKLKSEQN